HAGHRRHREPPGALGLAAGGAHGGQAGEGAGRLPDHGQQEHGARGHESG
ncbi:unnamed protein product, partial [Heterosigma akashiwo]